jgi:hypothetical protein
MPATRDETAFAQELMAGRMMLSRRYAMTTERPRDDELPEHERRDETSVGGGLMREGGTAPETEPRTPVADPTDVTKQPTSDLDDDEPEDPDGPEVAYQPKSI